MGTPSPNCPKACCSLTGRSELGLVIFALTYLLIAIQRLPFVRLNRPAAGLLGAVAMVLAAVIMACWGVSAPVMTAWIAVSSAVCTVG